MVVDTAATSSNEKTNVDDVVVNTQFYDEVQHTEVKQTKLKGHSGQVFYC